MKNSFITVITILCLLPGLAFAGDFRCEKVGEIPLCGHMVIAPGRNDGINRLYTGGKFPYEFTWTGSGWQRDSLTAIPSYIHSLAAGFGRNDSIWRLYAGDEIGARLWEYSYDTVAHAWVRSMIDDRSIVWLLAIAIGDIKNDDTLRVVAGGDDSTTIAYTFQKGSGNWEKDTLGVKREIVVDIAIGQGHNDDTNRVYSGGGRFWSEYTWNGQWDSTLYLSPGFTVTGLNLINIKADSIYRLYLSKDEHLYEYYWDGTQWVFEDTIFGLYLGNSLSCDGRNDGKKRIYVTSWMLGTVDSLYTWVHVYEFTYTTTIGWTKMDLDTIIYNPAGGPMMCMSEITVGNARNDGKNRIYGICDNGDIFEWTWDDTINGVEQEDVNELMVRRVLKVGPNPFYSFTNISNLPNNTEIKVYDITGRLVEQTNSAKVGSKLKAGVYFITAGGYKPAKMVKIK